VSAGTLSAERRRAVPGPTRTTAALASPQAAAVLALAALAAALRFVGIGHQGFWYDEGNTALLVHFSPGKMLGLVPQSESTPPLYYCVAWAWARIFGYGEAGLRSLSALAGVTTVPLAYGAARKLISERAGLIAAALTACNPLLIWYSQEARSYAMLVLWSAAALMAFAYALERPSRRNLALWALASVLALATHYYALLAVVPQAVWLLWAHRRSRGLYWALGAVGVCALALLALAISQNSTGRASWIATAPLGRRLGQLIPQFASGFPSPGHGVIEPIAVALAALAIVLLVLSPGPYRRGGLIAGALALAGFAINLLLVAASVDDLITRNVLALWMPAAVAVATGLAAARTAILGLLAAASLCGLGVASAIGIAVDRSYQRPDWRGVARVLGARPASATRGGRAILVQHYRELLPLSLYLPGLRWMTRLSDVSELDVVTFTSPSSAGFCWWGSACNLWPSVMQAGYPLPGFHEISRERVYQFTVLRLVADHPQLVTLGDLGRVLNTTSIRNDELLLEPQK
jgi:hypothetical protein